MDIEKAKVKAPDGTMDDCGHIVESDDFLLVLNNLQLVPDDYVFSIWIKSANEGKIAIGELEESTSDAWKKCIFHLEVNASEIILEFQPGEYWLYNAKLEIGDKATDWTPALEDVDEAIAFSQKTADGKNKVFYQYAMPSGGTYNDNDIWFDLGNGYKMYHYSDNKWNATEFGTDAIAASAITAGKIAAGAVTTGKLESFAVTAEKIAAGAIESDKIAANAITAGKIAAGAITAEKIAANAIEGYTIKANTITGDKIAVGSITAELIAANAITGDKIAAGSVTASNIDVTDLIATGFIGTNKLTAANIDVNNLFAQNIRAAGTIKSNNYSYSSGDYSNKGLELDMSTGRIRTKNFSVDASGNVKMQGIIEATAGGTIGGWNINKDSLSYGEEDEAGYMLLKPSTKTILTTGSSGRSLLTDGALRFERKVNGQNIGYAKFSSTWWESKPDIYGVGVHSEVESKFIAFGDKHNPTDDAYSTVFLLNYGLNPYKDANNPSLGVYTEDVIIYGTTRMCDKLLFGDGDNGINLTKHGGGIYTIGAFGVNGVPYTDYALAVTGDSYLNGNLKVIGDSYLNGNLKVVGDAYLNSNLKVTGDAYVVGDLTVEGHLDGYSAINHNMKEHTFTWTSSGNLSTGDEHNLASVTWVSEQIDKLKDSINELKKKIS